MEESAKRKERLKAMRMEAAHAEDSNSVDISAVPSYLANPLNEASATQPAQGDLCATPRFDFYTDPMSAFSANKRRSKADNEISQDFFTPPRPRISEMTPSPSNQFQTNYSPDQRMYQAPSPYCISEPHRSPVVMVSPFPSHQETPPGVNYSPDQRMYQAPGPYHRSGPHRSPTVMASPFPSHQGTSPQVWNESGGTASYCFPSNFSRGGNFPSPGSGGVGSPSFNSGQGRDHWFGKGPSPGPGRGGSPNPYLGRGRGRWFGNNMSPGSGRSGGRGFGSHDHSSAQDRPDRFFNKSMVEDPWKFLKPIIWSREDVKSLNTPDSSKSWLPKSVSMKKTRVSGPSNQSNSKFSLAEYLAASFNEAVKDE
ncbi:hypothetical protein L1049_025514 [Liquidambar formosana]|uniref:Hydroxyproline-rich glycoprotein family protein n=1 Tax=Liquidambar formosana TaxID=63359 RepID=A0AAP0R8H4_LIQFO